MPTELTLVAVTALLCGLLLVGIMLSGGRFSPSAADATGRGAPRAASADSSEREAGADPVMRVVWWLTITIVLLGVGISGSFPTDQAPIFLLGAGGVLAVVIFHELIGARHRSVLVRLAELITAIALVAGLLTLSGYASSPFAVLFALVAVAAALGFGPRAGAAAAGLATVAFGAVLLIDPALSEYGPQDALRLSFALGATWLLAFVATAYSERQRRAMRRVVDLSRTDPLTALFNRSQLFVTLDQEVSRTRRSDRGFCLLMIDVDGLKAINDSGGHLRGDEVLRMLGRVIAGSIRTVDSAYRYGGDEFVVLLPETDIVGAFVVAEKIRLGAEELGATVGHPSQASVSIGLVSHPEDGLSGEELMSAADRAMYQAKSLGKNQISGNPRPRPALLARRSVLDPAPARSATAVPVIVPERPPAREEPQTVAVEPSIAQQSPQPAPAPIEEPPAEETPAEEPVAEGRAVAVQLGPVVPNERPPQGEIEDEEADPVEVRRRIAAARRSFDPDDQVRRAMDAFFSPTITSSEPERANPPEH